MSRVCTSETCPVISQVNIFPSLAVLIMVLVCSSTVRVKMAPVCSAKDFVALKESALPAIAKESKVGFDCLCTTSKTNHPAGSLDHVINNKNRALIISKIQETAWMMRSIIKKRACPRTASDSVPFLSRLCMILLDLGIESKTRLSRKWPARAVKGTGVCKVFDSCMNACREGKTLRVHCCKIHENWRSL